MRLGIPPPRGSAITSTRPCAFARPVFVGTSGYNYPEWRGTFYPRSSAPTRCSPTMPSASRRSRSTTRSTACRPRSCWPAGRPARPRRFTFTLKAPRRITHDAKLRHCEDLTQTFCRTAQTLGSKLAVLLFQLPPNVEKNVEVLRDFTEVLPDGTSARVRVPPSVVVRRRGLRHPARAEPGAVRRRQREAERAGGDDGRLRATSDCATRATNQADIERWAEIIRELRGGRAYVYFKHEEQGLGPELRSG